MSQDTLPEQAVPVPPPSPRQVALGLFILFQLVFLYGSNAMEFLQWLGPKLEGEPKKLVNRVAPRFADEQGHGWAWLDKAETGMRRWMQLTGQDQDWSLFAPTVSKATGFPVVVLLWDEEPPQGPSIPNSRLDFDAKTGFNFVTPWQPPPDTVVWLPSENAPDDPNNFVKFGKTRVRRYEGQFYMNTLPYDDEPRARPRSRMTGRMRTLMTDAHDPVLKYLEWRMQAWQRAHPDQPRPKQVLLFESFFRIHGIKIEGEGEDRKVILEDRGWDGPLLVPQARWQPGATPLAGHYLVEPFDFSTQRFQPMAR